MLMMCLLHADVYLYYDMSVLFTCLRHIRATMEGEATYYFEQDLYYAADPLELAARNVAVLLHEPRSFYLYWFITG